MFCIDGFSKLIATINDKIKTIVYWTNAKLNGLINFLIKISINIIWKAKKTPDKNNKLSDFCISSAWLDVKR